MTIYNTITQDYLQYYILQLTLLLRITIFRVNYKIFLRETSPNVKNLSWKIKFTPWHTVNSKTFNCK